MGLAYGLVAGLINRIFLPGVPLFDPGRGLFASVLLATLGGGVIGLIAAWPEDVLPGVLLGSLAGALLTVVLYLSGLRGGLDVFSGTLVLIVITFLPPRLSVLADGSADTLGAQRMVDRDAKRYVFG